MEIRNRIMIELYGLIHILDNMESGKIMLKFFFSSRVASFTENQVPLVVVWFEGMEFTAWLKDYRTK